MERPARCPVRLGCWLKKSYETSVIAKGWSYCSIHPEIGNLLPFFFPRGATALRKKHLKGQNCKGHKLKEFQLSPFFLLFYFWICHPKFHFLAYLKYYKKGKKKKLFNQKSPVDTSGLVALVCSASVAKPLFWKHWEIMLLFLLGLSLSKWKEKETCEERSVFFGHKWDILFWFLFHWHT